MESLQDSIPPTQSASAADAKNPEGLRSRAEWKESSSSLTGDAALHTTFPSLDTQVVASSLFFLTAMETLLRATPC